MGKGMRKRDVGRGRGMGIEKGVFIYIYIQFLRHTLHPTVESLKCIYIS